MPHDQIGVPRGFEGIFEGLLQPRQDQLAEHVLGARARMDYPLAEDFRIVHQSPQVGAQRMEPQSFAFNFLPIHLGSCDGYGMPAGAQAQAYGDVRVQVTQGTESGEKKAFCGREEIPLPIIPGPA